jgi:hypothetical protein
MTTSRNSNAVFNGKWTTEEAPAGGLTHLLHDGNIIATFEADTNPRVIAQFLAFAQCAKNLEIANLVPEVPRVFITVDHETINKHGGGETVAVVEVTRKKDEAVARFNTTLFAHDDGRIQGHMSAPKATSDVVRHAFGTFVHWYDGVK